MPCRSEDYGESEEQLRIELDKATRLLCATLTNLEENGKIREYADDETLLWWDAHKRFDLMRKEEELRQMEIKGLEAELQKAQSRLLALKNGSRY